MEIPTEGFFQHFQLVNNQGEIPVSISVLIHYNKPSAPLRMEEPITSSDVIDLHNALQQFDGNFSSAFNPS